jgi:hypothetical protein
VTGSSGRRYPFGVQDAKLSPAFIASVVSSQCAAIVIAQVIAACITGGLWLHAAVAVFCFAGYFIMFVLLEIAVSIEFGICVLLASDCLIF